jgi:two-component system, cell cycle sensor histidine kinase PleC
VEVTFTRTSAKKNCIVLTMVKDISERKKVARERESTRDEFICMLLHDLRNALNFVASSLRITSNPLFSQSPRKKFESTDMIKHSFEVLLSMINNLANVSRIDSGTMNYKFEDFPLSELFRDLRLTFSTIAELSSITINFTCPDDLWVFADRITLGDIFFNLISNAIYYTPRDGIITTAASLRDNAYIYVSVADTGSGIAGEDLLKVFGKTIPPCGELRDAGLGLYIGKKFVKAHGSRIELLCERGKGTTFFFTLNKGDNTTS